MIEIYKIESLIQQKKKNVAHAMIVKWLRSNHDPDSVFQAAQWYRRLSFYKEGLRLISNHHPFEPMASSRTKLLAADFFSHLGAVAYAIQIIENFIPEKSDEFEILAGIYYSSGDYEKALSLFKKSIELSSNKKSYPARLTSLSCADCLARIGKIDEAIDTTLSLIEQSSEVLFLAICYQAIGEYLARQKRYKKALHWLLRAKDQIPGNYNSFDHALLCRWLGVVKFRLGYQVAGKKYLKLSSKIIQEIGLGDDVFFENLKIEKELKLLGNNEIARLGYFIENKELVLSNRKNDIIIYPGSNEYEEKGVSYLGIPLELQLLLKLRIAGDWGLRFETIESMLWKNEGRSYLQLENRLRQMLKRIKRRYRIVCKVENKKIFLGKNNETKIGVIYHKSERPRKLKVGDLFSRDEFQETYNLKKAQAILWIEQLASKGFVKRIGSNRSIRYQLVK